MSITYEVSNGVGIEKQLKLGRFWLHINRYTL